MCVILKVLKGDNLLAFIYVKGKLAMNQKKRKKTLLHRKMTIWEMILCIVLIPYLILSCIMIAKSFASEGLSGFGATIGVVTDSVNVATENQIDYSDATSLDSFEFAINADKTTVILTKYIGDDTVVSVAPQYVINDAVYNTILDSTTVFTLNTTITSVKLYPGVGFANNTMDHLFYQCGNLVSVDMEGVNTTGVTDMSYVFETCGKLTTIDMTGIDTSKVTTMYALFSKCKNLSSLVGYENWETSSLENIFWMFNTVQGMEVIDISKWDLSKINNSAWCFQHCYAKQILLPDNLKTISAGFLNHACKIAGTSFTIPVGVEKIGYAHTIYDFATDDFVEFIVPAENKHYVAIDGILYSADGKEMLAVPRNKAFENNTYFIPEGVEFLGELSFSRNENIHTLVLPNSYEIKCVPEFDERYIVFEDIGNLNGGNTLNVALYLYTGVTTYEVKDDNPRYESVDGIIYSEDMTTVLAIPLHYGRYINIPEGVTTFAYEAMWGYDTTDGHLAATNGINIPSTMIDIAPDQFDKLNRMNSKYANFEITVHPDNPVYSVDDNGNIVVTGEVTTMNETTRESYSTFAEAISNANDGDVITLLTDLSVSESINITSNLTLKSGKTENKYPEITTFALRAGEYVQEGNVIKRADGYTGTLFTVSEGATLTLDDGLIIDGGNDWTLKIDELKDAVNNYVDQKYNTALAFVTPESDAPIATDHMFVVNGSLVINNATIKNNISLEGKSLICVGMGGKLVMNDGAVITKIAGYSIGSVAFFDKGSTFDMNGGEISWSVGNENSALLNNDGAVMTMNGGVIKNNHATNSMGMIMRVDSSDASYPAKLIINDGLICNNVALPGSNGPNGSVFDIVKNGYFEMHGGTMCHNVGRRAVTINHRGVHAEITGGTIVDNIFLYTSGAPSGAFDTSTTITGGTFGTDIREGFMGSVTAENAIPSGYEIFENSPSQGLWSVEQGYMVTFTDRDGNVLQSAPVRIGDTPVFYSDYSPIDNPEAYVWVWDQEMVPITDSDATYTGRWELAVAAVVKKDNPDDPVKYYDFLTAIDAAGDGDTVLLLADIAMTSAVNITGKSITIDAGNHTITRGKDSNGAWYTGQFFNIPSGASLTLDGGLTIDGANNWTYNKTDGVYDLKNAVDNYVDFTGYNKHHFITYEPNGAVAIETMIYVTGSLTINEVTIQNNAGNNLISVGNGGLLTTNEKAVFTHNACESSGTVVYMGTGSTFIMNGGTMTQNVGGDHGGCVRIDGGQMIMNGGLVQHNHTAFHASFVRLDYNASFTMNGGKICENVCFPSTDNKNKAGSVIDVARSSSTVTINGGTICHNYGYYTGGINHVGKGLNISGGAIVDNIAWGQYNGISNNDIFYAKPATITGGTFSTHPLVSCTAADKSGVVPVTHKVAENDDGTYTVREKFQLTVTFEGIDGSVSVMEDDLVSAPAENPTKLNHIFEGWDYDFSQPITQDTHIKAIWTEAVASIENGGTTTYYRTLQEAIDAAEALAALGDGTEIQTVSLLKNITINKMITVDSGNITIDGNGFTIIRSSDNPETTNVNEAYTGTFFTVKAGATLTLDGGLTVDGGNDWEFHYDKYYDDLIDWQSPVTDAEYAEWFTIDPNDPKSNAFMFINNGTLNLNKVTIQNNYTTGATGVVRTTGENSVANLNGAHIHHIAAKDGQGVVVKVEGVGAVANINKDTLIEWNHGGQNFCLLCAWSGGTLNINGGEISSNYCWDSGGIIGTYYSNLNMTDGKICGNACANTPSSYNYNSVFYFHNGSVINISGGEVSNNIHNYGAITKLAGATIYISDGKFENNTAFADYGPDIDGPTASNAYITGGSFMQDVNEWCDLGYAAFNDGPEAGKWTVEPGYWVTFTDEEGNVLQTAPLRIGATPTFNSELPETDNPDDYIWVWDKEFVPVADAPVTYEGSWKLAVAAVIKKDNPDDPNPTRYYDFYMAMDAAEDGDTVVLLADIEMNKACTIAGESITIDGDSHTITRGKNANGTWYVGRLFDVQADASLTLDGNLTIDGGNEWVFKEEEYNAAIKAEMAIETTAELVEYSGFDMATKEENAPVATTRMFNVSGNVILNNTTIMNHYGTGSNGLFGLNATGKLTLNGGTVLKHNACGDTSVIAYMNDESEFTINDGAEISGNYFAKNGGLICNRGGILTMNGGKIIDNRGVNCNGSVVMLYTNEATFIMNDGLICKNTSLTGDGAAWCNAIYLHSGSIVKIYGGSICHNSGGYNGGIGGFKNESSSKLYIEGGYIGENIARYGNVIGYKDYYDVLLAANPFHKGLSGGTYTQDVNEYCIPGYIAFANTPEAGKWTVEPGYWVTFADEEGNVLQKVPVRVGDTPVFSGELPAIENEDDYLWIWDKPIVPVTDSDVTYTGGWKRAVAEVIKKDNPDDPNPERFHELQLAINAAEDGDTVRLLVDIPLTSNVTVAGKSITLDGDGHTITRGKDANNAWYTGNLFTINADSALVLDGNLTVDGANNWTFNEVNGQKEYLYIAENYTNTPYDGALQFITSETDGANATAQMFLVDGSLTINSTTIKNHYSTKYSNTGAVSVIKVNGTGTLVVNDKAVLTHNATADRGTIVHMAQNSWFYMNGGELSWSVGYWHGGCINNVGGYMVMNGGSINNNHSTYGMGSVLFIYDGRAHASIPYPNFVMNGGEICYNVNIAGNGGGNGGAIYARNGLMEMHGGIIHHNYGRNQGGISVGSGIRITITEGAIVENIDLLGKYVTHDLDGTSTTNKISGGTFTQDVNAWCVTEYIAVPQEKGYVATVPDGVPPKDTSYEVSEDFTLWIVDKTSIESIGQEKEIFGTVTDSANTNINNDSAYTVEINVNHFYNKCYLSPEIHFSQNLPVNTTIILRDIDKDAPGYWAYTVKTETNSIPLSEFVRMGSTETFSTPMVKPAFRFVIDFSKTENGMPSGSLETSLKLIPATTLPTDNENYYKSGAVYWIPESEAENFEGTVAISPVENIVLADKKFSLETDTNGGFSSTIDYDVVINAEASKWDYREFALIINIPEAPTDAVLSALVNGSERTIIPYTPGNYIIPLGSVFKGQVIITLESNMFPINGKEYTATCSLYASESVADASPLNGEILAQKTEGLFTKTDDYASIKITGPLIDAVEKHVFDNLEDVNVTIDKIIPNNYTIMVQLEQKDSDGNYVKVDTIADQEGDTYTFDLDDCEPDSYRIVAFAVRVSDGFVSAQAPYYFIVE